MRRWGRIAVAVFTLLSLVVAPGAQTNTHPAKADPIFEVVVYGDSSGAVIAAISAKRDGHSVIWVNPTSFPGGMSSSGLGATDFLGRRNTADCPRPTRRLVS